MGDAEKSAYSARDEPAAGAAPRRRRGVRLEGLGNAAAFWYLSGLPLQAAALFAYSFLAPGPEARPTRRDVIETVGVFDTVWYASIATRGYSYDVGTRSSVAFFPLYPLLARAVSRLLPVRIETALLLVSNAAYLAALGVLAFYVRARYPSAPPELAQSVLLAAALFPTGCFFRLGYSESTFLLLTLIALLGIERRWPIFAVSLVVGLATAARPVGVALLAPLALDVWRRSESAEISGFARFPRRLARVGVYITVGCWGLGAYMAFQHAAFGDALAFARTQRHWGIRAAPDLPQRLWACGTLEPIAAVYQPESPAFWAKRDAHGVAWFSLQFANPLFFLGAVAIVFAGSIAPRVLRRRIGFAGTQPRRPESAPVPDVAVDPGRPLLNRFEISCSTLLLLIPYLTRGYEMGMASMGRFASVAFPLYLVLGHALARLPRPLAAALLAPAACLMAAYLGLFIAGYLIF